ncbi:diguanylate cyclase [Aquabacterium sp.]|uniref:sensor domain-containing diguanylate cyclase n=1 Tax=Aquabacterium sp. TaxID=1872578 RepID=UPI00261AB454|nr:diguanylate cyclase [Aquabacterium sp.]MDD2976273.1 diguanylate cyclase [Aquabacterium sp.]
MSSHDETWLVRSGLLRSALEQSFNSVLITDAQPGPMGPRIVYANPAFCEMTGYSATELLGQTPRILQGALTSPEVLQTLRECLQADRFFRGSTINYRKDGRPYTVEWNISPVKDEAGVTTHYVSVQQDISAVTEARATSQLLAQALDATQDAVMIANAQGEIEFVNHGFELITGYSRVEALGQNPAMLKSGEHTEAFYGRLWAAIQSGQTFRAVFINRHKQGHLIHCEETVSPIRDAGGAVTHFVSVIRDQTARAHTEQTLREQATRDPLTDLLNRRAGEWQLERAFLAAREGQKPFCLIMADVDHFKAINDTWGHPAGDQVLQRVAAVLRTGVRATDSVVRWGGEEFLLVLPYCEQAAALLQAERLRERVADAEQGEMGRVTVSMGVAELQRGETLANLMERVDQALYQAKHAGRNQVSGG